MQYPAAFSQQPYLLELAALALLCARRHAQSHPLAQLPDHMLTAAVSYAGVKVGLLRCAVQDTLAGQL